MKTPAIRESLLPSIHRTLLAAGLAAAIAAPAWASPADPMTRDNWHTLMIHKSAPSAGCFHASYPNTEWEPVDCEQATPGVHPMHSDSNGPPEVEGSGDYVAQTKDKIELAFGTFSVSGLTSETGVPVYTYKGVEQGILGPDQYSVQLNTNNLETTSACGGRSGCHVWQQFVYANNYPTASSGGKAFMQYWLLDWGSSCPHGWTASNSGNSCYQNSALLPVATVPITQLGELTLEGSASTHGLDSLTFAYENEFWILSAQDSVLDIASVWNKAEFNVLGNAGGSEAIFNGGTTVTVTLVVGDGTGTAPTCVANDGTTGESNNLWPGACSASDPLFPMITYTESND